jgi:hypothetical protein
MTITRALLRVALLKWVDMSQNLQGTP